METKFIEYINELHAEISPCSNEFMDFELGDFSDKLLKIYSDRNSTNSYEIVKKYLIILSAGFEKILAAEFENIQNSKTNQFVLVLPTKSIFMPGRKNMRKADLVQLDSSNLILILKLIYDILESSSDSLSKADIDYLLKTKENITKFRQMFRSQFIRIKKAASNCKIDIQNYN